MHCLTACIRCSTAPLTQRSSCCLCKMACYSAYCGRHATGALMQEGSGWQTFFALPTGGNAVPYLVPNKLQPGAILHLLPDTIKNKKGGHSSVTLTCDLLCLSTWLQLAVAQYAAAGQPITNYLTRPLQVGTKTYTEKDMTCSNAWTRLTKYLKELGMYTGQSVHSTKGGSMIHKQLQIISASHSKLQSKQDLPTPQPLAARSDTGQ